MILKALYCILCCAALYYSIMKIALYDSIVLYCTVLYCTVLYCTAVYCTLLYHFMLCCAGLHRALICCTVHYFPVRAHNPNQLPHFLSGLYIKLLIRSLKLSSSISLLFVLLFWLFNVQLLRSESVDLWFEDEEE